MKTMKYLLR